MTQIADQVGIHKSTVHRLLGTLERKRFLQRDPDTGIYRLGIRLVQMSYLAFEHNDLSRVALPTMRRLCEQYQETIHLAVLDETDVVFVNIIESPQRVKLAAELGQRLPAFATASGKAILAFLPVEALQRILKQGMPVFTSHTPRTPQQVLEEVQAVRKRGYALSEEEYEEDVNAVAAPIFDGLGSPVASIAIAGPAFRLTHERLVEYGPALQIVAAEISQALLPTIGGIAA